ncbi:hypothetical protein ACTFIW_010387 [Dictyostelium discoideum]
MFENSNLKQNPVIESFTKLKIQSQNFAELLEKNNLLDSKILNELKENSKVDVLIGDEIVEKIKKRINLKINTINNDNNNNNNNGNNKELELLDRFENGNLYGNKRKLNRDYQPEISNGMVKLLINSHFAKISKNKLKKSKPDESELDHAELDESELPFINEEIQPTTTFY